VPVRVVLAEDSYLVREGLVRLLESRPEIELVAACGDLDELVAAVEEHAPDAVITDIRMPPTGTDEGIRASERFRGTHPDLGVVVLSQYADPQLALALLERGSARRAYLLKERVADLGQLLAAVEEVVSGGSLIDPKVVDGLIAARSRAAESPLAGLTPREREVLAEMAQGKSNAAIAASLVLTERAVEKHVNSIFARLGLTYEKDVNKRVKAVLLYLAEESTSR
jgi:DNA-binding NarL/FixJ family response regulator